MLGPELLVYVPASLSERWAQGVRLKSGLLRWATNKRTAGQSDGRLCQVSPVVFFNAVGALEQVSQELHTVSAC